MLVKIRESFAGVDSEFERLGTIYDEELRGNIDAQTFSTITDTLKKLVIACVGSCKD